MSDRQEAPVWIRGVARGISVALVLAGAVIGVIGWSSATRASAATHGTATLSGDGNVTVTTGTLSTPFLLNLSAPGVCSGTSATAPQYFVFGFIVPLPSSGSSLGAELAAVNWSNPLTSYDPLFYDSAGDQYGPANTSTTGQPLLPASDFTFGYTDDILKSNSQTPLESASWDVGLACETGGSTVDYWAAQVNFDGNGNFTIGASSTPPTTTTSVGATTTTVGSGATTTTLPGATTTTTDTTTTTLVTTTSSPSTSVPSTTISTPTVSDPAASDPPASISSGSGERATLANTGSPVKRELDVAVILTGGGLMLFVLVTPVPPRRRALSDRRR